MSSFEYDYLILGGGSAGYNAASLAVKLGMRTAVVDGAETLGGLCILRGCMPSKALIESANRMLAMRRAGEFGLSAEKIGADMAQIQERKKRLIGEFADYRRGQLESGRFDLIRGMARFVDEHTVEVDGRRIRARAFLLATGSVIDLLPLPGLREAGFLDSDGVLELTELPASVTVLGGGAVAMEYAHFFHAMGCAVHVVQRGAQVLRECDADVANALQAALAERGVEFYLGTKLQRVERVDGKKRVCFLHGEAGRFVDSDEIVYCLGRRPNSKGMGLEAAGVELENGYLQMQATQQTSQAHIFAAGDVAGPHEIVHVAIQQAEVATRNAARRISVLGGELETTDYRLLLFGIFSHPEVAQVGKTEKQLVEEGRGYRVARYPFADHGKSLLAGEPHGFVKLLADAASGEILGGAVVGPHGVELIHEIVVAMRFRGTAAQLAATPHYHPTLSEIWTYPAEELSEPASGSN